MLFLAAAMIGFTAQADRLNTKQSPYSYLKSASPAAKAKFKSDVEKWLATQSLPTQEKAALLALVSEKSEVSGDEVLENLSPEMVAWFYGYDIQEAQPEKLYSAARITRDTDIAGCKRFGLCVVVSKAEQRMYVYEGGQPSQSGVHNQPISTARAGKFTPTGFFNVEELAGENRYSGLYKGAYLGYAMQIHGNIFLHATASENYSKLGSPASAGCVRMTKDNARVLNGMMKNYGRANVRVVVY